MEMTVCVTAPFVCGQDQGGAAGGGSEGARVRRQPQEHPAGHGRSHRRCGTSLQSPPTTSPPSYIPHFGNFFCLCMSHFHRSDPMIDFSQLYKRTPILINTCSYVICNLAPTPPQYCFRLCCGCLTVLHECQLIHFPEPSLVEASAYTTATQLVLRSKGMLSSR